MKIKFALLAIALAFRPASYAQNQTDSIESQQLGEIVVEAQMQRTSPTVSTYIPTKRQKNAAQTGPDLLIRMGIPQLGIISGDNVTTISGQSVDLFIDYLPASEQDLKGMRMTDVKKVEYYDYPQDPRFLGKARVINFVMQQYEYGGYVKAYANEFFISNSGQLNLYGKFQYKKMTYDLGVGSWYSNNDHLSNKSVETYRLPQPDGSIKEFERISTPLGAKTRDRSLWPTFKATYNSDKITMTNTIGANFYARPTKHSAGEVKFVPADFPSTSYTDDLDKRTNSITYSGYWNFILPHGNSLNVTPYYSYSHTRQNTLYAEDGGGSYANGAIDDTHRATLQMRFIHDFGAWGNVTVVANAYCLANHTRYTGTSTADDRLTTTQFGPGLVYDYKNDKLNGGIAAGFNYQGNRFSGKTDHTTYPWLDAWLQWSFNSKNSLNLDFHHTTWIVDQAYRSTAVIQSNPLLSITGNPNLKPNKSYDLGLRYTWLPNNKWNFAAFANTMILTDRLAYVYQPSPTGILRTIGQNLGGFSTWRYGMSLSGRLLNNSLMINGQVSHFIVRDGKPFDYTRQKLLWYLQAFYYVGGWNFGVQYQSPWANNVDNLSGRWELSRSAYTGIIGYGNSTWSVEARFTNPFRWDWKSGTTVMKSQYYDTYDTFYNTSYHAYVLVSATYTFGFGKKIQRGNEASQMTGTSSSILK